MGYKPTLGGLKKAQEFLGLKGYPMPIFQMDIYDDVRTKTGLRQIPGKGRTISIDEAIRKYGATYEVVDVRLISEQGDKFIQFNDTARYDRFTDMLAKESGRDVILEFHRSEPGHCQFKDFMDSSGDTFINLARWGKTTISTLDWIKFHLFPKRYAAEVFTSPFRQ